ncbi:hypothetical protein F4860DRAFT_489531 [Xylaria cubensis]|nr:hypothetical protein F4860DRAFT_489531 [Xylaria cubensis]
MTHYQLTCIKSWTSFRPGSDETVYGRYETIEQANFAILGARERLEGRVDNDGWTGGQLRDGRLWYNCDDWGHEEYYKLRIRKQTAREPNSLARYLQEGDAGNNLKLSARILQVLDASDQFRLLLKNDSARKEAIDRVAAEIDVSDQLQLILENETARETVLDRMAEEFNAHDQFELLLENDNAREEIVDRMAEEFNEHDQFELLLENDAAREEVIDRIVDESDTSEWFEHVLDSDIGREEVIDRIQLEHSQRHARHDGPKFEDVALERILDTEGGAEEILDHLRQSTRKTDQQFEEFALGKIMEADHGVGEILEDITSRKVAALSNRLRAELTRDIRRELEVKIREEIRLEMASEDNGASVAIKAEDADELADLDGERRRKRARRAY